ncbi:helix-turn-helix domain-containing protein [Chromobacterium amazonense]|uniref:Helix-turn-helix transcriptional regulator n=1 Tax=Chromobacterium amazonense TaxID=1382803 RepID=A0ABU8V2I6_9NEIS|nr:helix-turn-helix transcriptional regulator [Chromobacterium amazonense]MBM2883169.1 helix-turn-helix transcriptional regulator [Chromobacterium amazonense]MDE1715963.1 helix-turn-helix transcriptional regulator [Chromobacterium amazonense]MDQ4538935.1 helix-turn-helix transcriptional regulator [Chromobacterium amazonense]
MPVPASDLIQRFVEKADSADMLTLLDWMAEVGQSDAPCHLRDRMAADLRLLLAETAQRQQVQAKQLGRLTDAEVSVAFLIAAGRSYRQAAQALGITERTIRAHVENAYRKLGLKVEAGRRLDVRLLVAHIFLPEVMQRVGLNDNIEPVTIA